MIRNTKSYFEKHDCFFTDLGKNGYMTVTLEKCDGVPYLSCTSLILDSVEEVRKWIKHNYTEYRIEEYLNQYDEELAEAIDEAYHVNNEATQLPNELQDMVNKELNEILNE